MGNNSSRARNKNKMTTPVEITGQQGEKGMFNSVGLQHCFLNVVIQSLWHIGSFRERFIRLPHHQHKKAGLTHDYVDANAKDGQESDAELVEHADATPPHTEDGEIGEELAVPPPSASPVLDPLDDPSTCVCCALKLIFVHYEHSDASIIPPDTLRFALSLLLDNHGSQKFRLKEMSDAEEAFDEILKYLHFDHVGAAAIPPPSSKSPASGVESELSRGLDVTCNPSCIAHQVFGNQLMDQRVCQKCKATSDPEINSTFLYRIYVSEIVRIRKATKGTMTFENILKSNYLEQNYSCPFPQKTSRGANNEPVHTVCAGPAKIERFVLSMPEVFTMMCVWAGAEQERSEIQEFFNAIPQQLHLDRFLKVQSVEQSSATAGAFAYRLRGMILFYGRHYISIFWSQQFNSYIMFDDRRVTRIGDWSAVVDRCCRGKLQPTVLFYESCDPAVRQKLLLEMAVQDEAAELTRKAEERQIALTTPATLPQTQPPAAVSSIGTLNPTPLPAPSIPPRPVKPAAEVLSPTTQSTQQYFGTSSTSHGASSHIIPAPVGHPSHTAAASSSSSGVASTTNDRAPIAIIPDYIPRDSNDQSDDGEWERWWATSQQGNRQTSGNNGYASPAAQVLRPTGTPTRAQHWICLTCSEMHSASQYAHGNCPKCSKPAAVRRQEILNKGEIFRLAPK